MAVWYSVRKYASEITTDDFQRETDVFLITPSGRRVSKIGPFSQWFKSLEEAKSFLRAQLERSISKAKTDIAVWEAALRSL
jgi:hypothetical protein